MPSPNRKRLKLAEMRTQAVDSLGMEPGLELELDGGEVVTVPNPMLAADGVQELLKANKVTDAAKLILGVKDHARLLKHGGHSNDVLLAWRLMEQDIAKDDKSD
jgi:hypothetical protein